MASNTPSKNTSQSLWGGRFQQATEQFVQRFTASIDFDQQLYQQDITGSIAHATMLARAGILTEAEKDQIINGLTTIQEEIETGAFDWHLALEDIHLNIEARLTEKIGETGKKLHTGRSRNDQVATDLRLYLRQASESILTEISRLQNNLLSLAKQHPDTIMPGFTHLQTAQPVTFGHHLLAWWEMLERDYGRLLDSRQRLNQCPLGAAALAGTSFAIDPHYSAQLLGFDKPCENSLDAVSDRDFAVEFCAAASLLMAHLSRFSEELVLWASAQFDFIELPDRFCTGSSIMPQKKNPDVPELVRGKSGRVYGHLMALLTLIKSQPLAYNKDNQEDKEPLFDTVQTLSGCLRAYADMVPHIQAKADNMRRAALQGYATATDLADYLVKQGLAFRDAHHAAGKIVAYAIDQQKDLAELSIAELQILCPAIKSEVSQMLTLEGSVNARSHFGGTAPQQVQAAIQRAQQRLQQHPF
jgi:argininosuccinate lyase